MNDTPVGAFGELDEALSGVVTDTFSEREPSGKPKQVEIRRPHGKTVFASLIVTEWPKVSIREGNFGKDATRLATCTIEVPASVLPGGLGAIPVETEFILPMDAEPWGLDEVRDSEAWGSYLILRLSREALEDYAERVRDS